MAEDEDVIYDEVTGAKGKRRILDGLNKSRRLTRHEMDEMFCEWE